MKKEKLDKYIITIDDETSEEELGIDQIAFVKNPAIKVKGFAFSSQKQEKMKFADEPKMRVVAPIMIPGDVYRNEDGYEYEVVFTEREIEEIYKKFMQQLSSNSGVFNKEHSKEQVPAYILEAILVDTESKAKFIKDEYKFEVPVGSVVIVAQITDEEYFKDIVDNERTAFSIEGFLSLIDEDLGDIIDNIKKEQMKKQEFNLPDGEWMIDGKIYVVKDGDIKEIKEPESNEEAPKGEVEAADMPKDEKPEAEVEAADMPKEDAPKEEVKAEDMPKEDEPKVEAAEDMPKDEEPKAEVAAEDMPKDEEPKAEVAAEDMPKDEEPKAEDAPMEDEKIAEMVDKKVEEKLSGITEMIADLKMKLEDINSKEEEDEKIEMSAHERKVKKALAFHQAFGK